MCRPSKIENNTPFDLRPRQIPSLYQAEELPVPNNSNNLDLHAHPISLKFEYPHLLRKHQRTEIQACYQTPISKVRILECPPTPRHPRTCFHNLPFPIPEHLFLPQLDA